MNCDETRVCPPEKAAQNGGKCRMLLSSCWKLPLVALLCSAVWVLGLVVLAGVHSWSGEAEWSLNLFEVVALVLTVPTVLAWLVGVIWLLVHTVLGGRRRAWSTILRCWGSLISAALLAVAFMFSIFFWFLDGGHSDWYILGCEIPADRYFVAPRDMRAVLGDVKEPTERAKALLDLRPRRQPLQVMVKIPPLPNLEKLTREAPDVLQEYMVRCLYAEATDPRFDAQILSHWHEPVALVHKNDPQSNLLLDLQARELVDSDPEGDKQTEDDDVWKWSLPLHNGWSVVLTDTGRAPVEEEDVAGSLKLLEDSLAALAANPSPEYLDSILPPLPRQPFLSLWDAGYGEYHALVVLPAGHPAGEISLRVREISTGKRVHMHLNHMPIAPLGEVCSVARDGAVAVSSGCLNEFYASEWEIWFTPEEGGESRCLSRQEFLLMGADW